MGLYTPAACHLDEIAAMHRHMQYSKIMTTYPELCRVFTRDRHLYVIYKALISSQSLSVYLFTTIRIFRHVESHQDPARPRGFCSCTHRSWNTTPTPIQEGWSRQTCRQRIGETSTVQSSSPLQEQMHNCQCNQKKRMVCANLGQQNANWRYVEGQIYRRRTGLLILTLYYAFKGSHQSLLQISHREQDRGSMIL